MRPLDSLNNAGVTFFTPLSAMSQLIFRFSANYDPNISLHLTAMWHSPAER